MLLFYFTGLVMQVSKQNILQAQGKQKVQLALTVIKGGGGGGGGDCGMKL